MPPGEGARRLGEKPMKLIAFLIAGSVIIVDGDVHTASAQCPPGSPIYVDPRLVPQRPQISRQAYVAIEANPSITDDEKKKYSDLYLNQNQPIQLPFRNGIVLISPKDPCIQQYLGN
jgi:hypothetical protein